jgi:AcrR family transcriptional regulator
MVRRAEQVSETRARIVDATVHLHGTVGPAATTVSAIAEHAGVTRLTVYRHFPDDEALFAACSAHWLSRQSPPDPRAWTEVTGPAERIAFALGDLYRFFAEGEAMLTRVHRDRATLPPAVQRSLDEQDRQHRETLFSAFTGLDRATRRRVRAAIGHAVDFRTWHSLCRSQGLSGRQAVEMMTTLVMSSSTPG